MSDNRAFDALAAREWQTVVDDPCTDDWRTHWFLDGETATITNTSQGMDFFAGPNFGNDADHAVLWTRRSFAGDLRIDYEFTRLDNEHRCVNILYVQATGSGDGPYATDICTVVGPPQGSRDEGILRSHVHVSRVVRSVH